MRSSVAHAYLALFGQGRDSHGGAAVLLTLSAHPEAGTLGEHASANARGAEQT